MSQFDIIGDIHGHADELEALLKKMGYSKSGGFYSHPDRKALFVGDYIDRGPQIRETLQLVKAMVDNDQAIALMGNHEYNALCFHYEEREGGHLRKHEIKNILQHYQTLLQFKNRQEEYDEYIDWFLTLPLFYEDEDLRVVHACWDNAQIKTLREILHANRLTERLLHRSIVKDSELYKAIEITLKGKEIQLPSEMTYQDKDGFNRSEIRIKWWMDPRGQSYKSLSVIPSDSLPEDNIKSDYLKDTTYYTENEKPVFFGHYWLTGKPRLQKDNVCCLDYSVAKNGSLVAYQFSWGKRAKCLKHS